MTKLTVLTYPDPRLRKKALLVAVFDEKLSVLIDDLFETMYADEGVGLAATQANIQQRVLVADPQNNGRQPFYMVNPLIVEKEGIFSWQEGCLSVPGTYEYVDRANKIKVAYQDKLGVTQVMEAEGYIAVIIQHEIDHLDGKLFIDYLSLIKRERARKRILNREHQ
jgi:peptide deformylase